MYRASTTVPLYVLVSGHSNLHRTNSRTDRATSEENTRKVRCNSWLWARTMQIGQTTHMALLAIYPSEATVKGRATVAAAHTDCMAWPCVDSSI